VVKRLRDMEKDSIKITPFCSQDGNSSFKIWLWGWSSGSDGKAPA
jgi:hypothetical protein